MVSTKKKTFLKWSGIIQHGTDMDNDLGNIIIIKHLIATINHRVKKLFLP